MSEARANRMMMNPMIRKLDKVTEQDPTHAATYGGIAGKTCFFMLWAVVGIAAFYMLRSTLEVGQPLDYEGYIVYPWEAMIALVSLLLSVLAPLLAFWIKPLTPVLGSIYCAAFAYSMTWLGNIFAGEYAALIATAVGITVLLVALTAILYATRVVKVDRKFRSIVTILFFTMVFSGILYFIGSLIPGLNKLIAFFQQNAALTIVFGVIYVIIACLFLFVDFDTIEQTVKRQLPKKYEWIAAFGLSYTIFYLFLKVFHLLVSVKNQESN